MGREGNKQVVGYLEQKIIDLLELDLEPAAIYIGKTNIEHMEQDHPEDYKKYYQQLSEIIGSPDYVGKHPSKNSIEYIKCLDEHVLVAVRISQSGRLFARSLYAINAEKLARYLESGTTVKFEDK